MQHHRPILIFDSGLGGLTVAEAIDQRCPGRRLVYVGDTAGAYYGSKSPDFIAHRAITLLRHFVATHDPCHVVLACNTTSALVIEEVRAAMPNLSISGVIEPGARDVSKAAGELSRPVLGVLATSAALRSRAYHTALGKRRMRSQILLRPAPLLVPMVEEGRPESDPLVKAAIREYTRPLRHAGVDVLLLGCAHYPVYRRVFERYMPRAIVIDSATACADDLARRLTDRPSASDAEIGTPELECHVTDDPDRFRRLARRVCGLPIGTPELVNFDRITAEQVGKGRHAEGNHSSPSTLRVAG